MTNNSIDIHPSIRFLTGKVIMTILICVFIYLLTLYLSKYLVYPYRQPVLAIILIYALFLYIRLLIYYLKIRCTKWVLTDDQLIYYRGIISRKVDYLELFRINDFYETSSVVERLLRIKKVHILSSDQTLPSMLLFGIINVDIIDELRIRVIRSRKQNNIYEISNR